MIVVLGASFQAAAASEQDAQAAFAKIKTLEGVWVSEHRKENGEMSHSTITYEIVSGGSAVIENAEGMVTVYHLNGDKLMLTHYCEAQNQPRLITESFNDPNSLEFRFLDITNKKDGQGFINGMRMIFLDANHIKTHWQYLDGSVQSAMEFSLIRSPQNP
jgi:hypothetical protein